MAIRYCRECFKKQRKIDELEGEVARLKDKLRYQERTAKEGFFGSSTPSSKVPVKPLRSRSVSSVVAEAGKAIRVMAGRAFPKRKLTGWSVLVSGISAPIAEPPLKIKAREPERRLTASRSG